MKDRETISIQSDTFPEKSETSKIEEKEILKGQRISLRSIENSDKDIVFIQKLFTDPEVGQYFSDPKVEPFKDNEKAKQIVESMLKDGEIFLIMETQDGKPIGGCILGKGEDQNYSFGIYIGEKEYEGKGYASEASKLIIDYGFEKFGVEDIYSNTHENNERSKKLLENLGFHEYEKADTVDEDKIIKNGKIFNRLYYKLSKEEWVKRNK